MTDTPELPDAADELIDGDDGRRYWVPAMAEPGAPWRKGTSLRWLLGAGLLVLVTLVVGVLVLGSALDGISTSKQAKAVDDYADALRNADRTVIGNLACPADFSQVQAASATLLDGHAITKAERKGTLHRDSATAEHATVRLDRSGASTIDVTVAVAKHDAGWCVSSVTPRL